MVRYRMAASPADMACAREWLERDLRNETGQADQTFSILNASPPLPVAKKAKETNFARLSGQEGIIEIKKCRGAAVRADG